MLFLTPRQQCKELINETGRWNAYACSVVMHMHAVFDQDVRALIARLHCLVSSHEIPNWQHLDFIWGLDAARVLYDKIVDILLHDAAL